MKNHSCSLISKLVALSVAVALCLPVVVAAASGPGAPNSRGGDSIGTAPRVGGPAPASGFQIEMPVTYLPAFARRAQGSGSFQITALPEAGRVRVTLQGKMSVRLSKSDVARGRVSIDYTGAPGASHWIQNRRMIVLVQR